MTPEQQEIERLKKENADLKASLLSALPGAFNVDGIIKEFSQTTKPGTDAIHKTIEQLTKVKTQLEPILKTLASLDKEQLEKIMKK